MYPAGLAVGYVESLSSDPSGLAPYAVVKPASDIDHLTHVYVLTSSPAEEVE